MIDLMGPPAKPLRAGRRMIPLSEDLTFFAARKN
jgi:hypothetical protein